MMPSLRFDRRAAPRFLAALACLAAFAAAGADTPVRSAPPAQKAPLKTTTLKLGPHPLKVEIAASDPERETGLMHRPKLGANDGMLFVFDEPAYHAMWMKNTLIPLSVAFVDREGVILNILDMEPQTLDTHQSAGPSIYAIETNKGWFAAKGVKAGDRVTGLPRAPR